MQSQNLNYQEHASYIAAATTRHAENKQRASEQPLMTAAAYAALEARYAEVQQQFAGNRQVLGSPMHRAHVAALHQLMAEGFDLPKPGSYVVAAFPYLPRNPLQSLGRTVYYRNPRRYHFLLPLLGETAAPRHPGHASAGPWHRPQLQP